MSAPIAPMNEPVPPVTDPATDPAIAAPVKPKFVYLPVVGRGEQVNMTS
jgi:hypothetical protein